MAIIWRRGDVERLGTRGRRKYECYQFGKSDTLLRCRSCGRNGIWYGDVADAADGHDRDRRTDEGQRIRAASIRQQHDAQLSCRLRGRLEAVYREFHRAGDGICYRDGRKPFFETAVLQQGQNRVPLLERQPHEARERPDGR